MCELTKQRLLGLQHISFERLEFRVPAKELFTWERFKFIGNQFRSGKEKSKFRTRQCVSQNTRWLAKRKSKATEFKKEKRKKKQQNPRQNPQNRETGWLWAYGSEVYTVKRRRGSTVRRRRSETANIRKIGGVGGNTKVEWASWEISQKPVAGLSICNP
jgi:hypothetical protein